MNKRNFWIGALAVGCMAAQAPATVQYFYVTDTPAVQAAASATVSVKIYLEEQVTGGDSSLLFSEGGLFGAGAGVTRNAPVSGQSASLLSLSPATGANGFNNPPVTQVTAGEADGFWAISAGSSGVVGTSVGPGEMRVLLGMLNVQAGAAGDDTSFTIHGFQDNTLTASNGYALDDTSADPAYIGAGSTTFTVQAASVPEPGTLGLLGLGTVSILARRRRAAKIA